MLQIFEENKPEVPSALERNSLLKEKKNPTHKHTFTYTYVYRYTYKTPS